ncbi:helix-turn-helix domain-containing protein [Kitasatospora sp. NPDC004289]
MADKLGGLLRGFRDEAGLTQEQVAERSGVSVRTIRRLESGSSTNHRMGTVQLLADALGLGEQDRARLAATLAGSPGDPVGPTTPATTTAPDEPPASVPTAPDDLTAAALELATEVRRRWRREEAQRRVHDPFPLPVRWQAAPSGLTDRPENIQRLGPGGRSQEVDLGGDLRAVAEVYRRIPSGRLVILGRAGSGKSVLAIRFTLDLLAAPAAGGRVPVILGVGSWDPSTTALRDWLVARLLRDHPHLARRSARGATLAAALVDADLVLPVLDGFDEMAPGLRREALEALNATSSPLVLTSRRAEYADAVGAAHAPLVWAGAVELTDLTLDDLADYLPRTTRAHLATADSAAPAAGRPAEAPAGAWDAVLARLRRARDAHDPRGADLAAVLTTPLMVILARTLYSDTPGRDPAELLDPTRFPTARSLEEHLLAGFVPAVYRRRAPERDAGGRRAGAPFADPARAERWLGHLARHLNRLDHEQRDLAWWQLSDSLSRRSRSLAVVLATGLSVAIADWLLCLLLSPLPGFRLLLQGTLLGLAAGLAFGSVYALADRSRSGAPLEPAGVRLTLRRGPGGLGRRPLRTFAIRAGQGLFGGAVMGTGCALALTTERAVASGTPLADRWVVEGTLIDVLVFALTFGLAAALVFGLVAALEAPVDVTAAATPAVLLASNRTTVGRQFLVLAPALTLAIALTGRLLVQLLRGSLDRRLEWEFWDGLLIGAVGGLGGAAAYLLAFTAWGQWLLLARIWLPLTGRLPWDPAAFLDDAYQRGVLRQTGAVHQFRHLRLQHHLGGRCGRTPPGLGPGPAAGA